MVAIATPLTRSLTWRSAPHSSESEPSLHRWPCRGALGDARVHEHAREAVEHGAADGEEVEHVDVGADEGRGEDLRREVCGQHHQRRCALQHRLRHQHRDHRDQRPAAHEEADLPPLPVRLVGVVHEAPLALGLAVVEGALSDVVVEGEPEEARQPSEDAEDVERGEGDHDPVLPSPALDAGRERHAGRAVGEGGAAEGLQALERERRIVDDLERDEVLGRRVPQPAPPHDAHPTAVAPRVQESLGQEKERVRQPEGRGARAGSRRRSPGPTAPGTRRTGSPRRSSRPPGRG